MRRCPQGMPMAENPENRQYWYALRVTYGREMLVKGYLDGIGVESYTVGSNEFYQNYAAKAGICCLCRWKN